MSKVFIEKPHGKNNFSWFRVLKILLIVIFSCVILLGIFIPVTIPRESANRLVCNANLRALGLALCVYAQDHNNNYPTPEKWCDLLGNKYGDFYDKTFRCPGGKGEMCSYAINPNCEPNSPKDIVLLFETKGGWNQVGGPELLTMENHKGEGCNVVFGDWHVEYVKAERIAALKWDKEKQDSESIE
jgi:prepilin-type processing-associated H-X9-DG protein